MDEKPIQMLGEIRERISEKALREDPDTQLSKPGEVEKIDSEYIRMGTASIFMITEPLGCCVRALKRRTKGDFAQIMR